MPTPEIASLPEEQLRSLADASLIIHAARDHDELLTFAARLTAQMLDAEGCNIVLRDLDAGDLVFYVVTGEKSCELKSFRLAEGEGITGRCIRTATSIVCNDIRGNPAFSPRADAKSGFTTRNVLSVPLVVEGACIGAATVVNQCRPTGFTEQDRIFCEAVASQIAVAVRNVHINRAALKTARLAAIGEAVAGVAHCMKNVLVGLRGGLQIVRKELEASPSAPRLRGLDLFDQNCARLFDLVQGMLAYAKDDGPEYGRVDLNETIGSVVDLMRLRAQERKLELLVQPHPEVGLIEADREGIYRCVLNLVSNAVDACEKQGSRIQAAVRRTEPDWVAVEVSDDGAGMTEDTRCRLFQPFFSTKGSRGIGLGLSVTQKIVREHGGRIDVVSELGKGSSFRISLPCRRPAPDLGLGAGQ